MANQMSSAYEKQVLELIASGRIAAGRVNHIEIQHDPWCGLLKNSGPCNCNPTARIIDNPKG